MQVKNRHFDFEQNWLSASNNESHMTALIRTRLEFRQVDTLQLTKFEAFCNKTIPTVDSRFMVRTFSTFSVDDKLPEDLDYR